MQCRSLFPVAVLSIGIMAFSTAGPTAATAGQQSADLTVSATVAANCTITTAALAFGAYDPVGTNATTGADLDGTGTVTIACTRGAVTSIELGNGANFANGTRRMSNGAGSFLEYGLFQDVARTVVWGAGTDKKDTGTAAGTAPVDHTVFGRVPKGQDPATGTYSDTVVATVNF